MTTAQLADSQALRLTGISKHFGSFEALGNVSLTIPRGSLVCFLGPSGCGKTTLLRIIAGLEHPTSGQVLIDGEDVTHQPAHKRNLGMVFQSLALFPHLNVGENIAYGMRIRGKDRKQQASAVEELLQLVRLPGMESRAITQLSGGQRQRVAIARALALEPRLFLLDEPLSALDAKLHEEMQIELKLLQQRVGVTTIMVTHDQREALTVADLIVVMADGQLQQVGAPLEIYRNPANTFVAGFVGTSNLLPGTLQDDGRLKVMGHHLRTLPAPVGAQAGTPLILSIRPEEVRVLAGDQGGDNRLPGTVSFVRDVGQSIELYVTCGEASLIAHTQPRDRLDVRQGDLVTLELAADRCVLLAE